MPTGKSVPELPLRVIPAMQVSPHPPEQTATEEELIWTEFFVTIPAGLKAKASEREPSEQLLSL